MQRPSKADYFELLIDQTELRQDCPEGLLLGSSTHCVSRAAASVEYHPVAARAPSRAAVLGTIERRGGPVGDQAARTASPSDSNVGVWIRLESE